MGNGSVSYSVAPNPEGSPRTGTLSVAGETFAVTQAAACPMAITPSEEIFAADGGSGSVAVDAPSGCGWTAAASDGWVHLTSGSTGIGPGTVAYAVDVNFSTSPRSGSMTVAGRTLTVWQNGVDCTFGSVA